MGIANQTLISVTWSAFASATAQVPDVDTEIDVEEGWSIAIQGDTRDTANVSTNVDIYAIASLDDGTTYDTEPFIEMNLRDTQAKTKLITPGVSKIKIRANNNDVANNAAPFAKIFRRG